MIFFMEASAVKSFFACLSKTLISEQPGLLLFTEDLRKALDNAVPYPVIGTRPHDISYLVYRVKLNALGMPDPVDGQIRNTPATLIPFVCELLTNRWNIIKDTPEDYTLCSTKKNHLAVTFVKELISFSLDALKCEPLLDLPMRRWLHAVEIGDNKVQPNFYALLIPTLTQAINPISLEMITNIELHRLVLSQDETSLISLKNSEDWFKRGEGFFNIDQGEPRLFTPLEKKRIKQKPREFWPSALLYTDYIVTCNYPGPVLNSAIQGTILDMLDQAAAVESDPNLKLEAFKRKYRLEKKPLEPEYIKYLWEAKEAKFRDEFRTQCQLRDSNMRDEEESRKLHAGIERLKVSFNTEFDISGSGQSDSTLAFLALKARQAKIATITAEMLVYCDVLKHENPDQHRCLMNQVLVDGKKQPKTFEYILKYVPDGIDCSSVVLLSDLRNLFKPLRTQEIKIPVRTEVSAVSPSASSYSGMFNIFSFFTPSSEQSQNDKQMAYSPDSITYIK